MLRRSRNAPRSFDIRPPLKKESLERALLRVPATLCDRVCGLTPHELALVHARDLPLRLAPLMHVLEVRFEKPDSDQSSGGPMRRDAYADLDPSERRWFNAEIPFSVAAQVMMIPMSATSRERYAMRAHVSCPPLRPRIVTKCSAPCVFRR